MSAFPMEAAEEIGIPVVLFFTISACSLMGYIQFPALVEKGLVPLKDDVFFTSIFVDASCLTNGFLDKVIDWIPGMKGIRLWDLPKDMRVTNPNDKYWKYCLEAIQRFVKGSAVVVHSFDALEKDVLDALSSLLPVVYAIGPLQLLLNQMPEHSLHTTGYGLWKEETECFKWLNSKSLNSVVYVNFGSLAFVTPEQLVEFGWGLANSKLPFIWVIRPDLERGLIASWCPQEQVLEHPSVGGFLTHSGWNSTVESLCAGVPMLCWPCSNDQPTNCCYACKEWGVGMEISNDVKRDEVEKLVKELMEGEKGKKMKNKVMEWKKLAEAAASPHGSSSANLHNFVNQVLSRKTLTISRELNQNFI
ncbi:7-deoxyloganetin glucosyltransferase-like [Pyrus ussuriensis x Pyrus communis]|uniref:7-deoxyloganetin glucosyltransferase-like n=1 Tax=Pyrus ussuriensis x Pyrus communis TaxID=2448454 RepID=A0A5N5FH76_9ROSA|nr:7-deoxyloganetin glucosyltransferase-like [Pyrus ussuriensis x Pyrus communis]